MKLGLYKTIKYHRQLWKWLSETGVLNKQHWPKWLDAPKNMGAMFATVYDDVCCFFCTYSNQYDMEGLCDKCPGSWPTGQCDGTFGLWTLWKKMEKIEDRKYLAYIISNVDIKRYPLRKLARWNKK